jgi:hypothetical protein
VRGSPHQANARLGFGKKTNESVELAYLADKTKKLLSAVDSVPLRSHNVPISGIVTCSLGSPRSGRETLDLGVRFP